MFEFTWQYFSNLPEIKRLPLHEQKKLFLIEAQNWRDYQNYNMMMAKGGPQSNGSTSGIGADGPLNGATVTARGISVTTNALGEFTFPFELGADEEVTITGGTDSITGVAFEGELKGYITPTVKVVSPLTTIAYYDEDAATFDEALDNVILIASDLGFTGIDKTILNEDYVKKSIIENDDKAVALQAFTTYVDSLAEVAAPAIKDVATLTYGTPTTLKQSKINLYKAFSKYGSVDIEEFLNTEVRGEITDTQTAVLQNLNISIGTVLKNELVNIVKDSIADSNYRTTKIQSVNYAIKRNIKLQAEDALRTKDSTLVKIKDADILPTLDTAATKLAQISTTSNVTERVEDTSKLKSLIDISNQFREITFSTGRVTTGNISGVSNIYALTSNPSKGTQLYINTSDGKYVLPNASVTVDIKGTPTKVGAWALTNLEYKYIDLSTITLTGEDGVTTYTVSYTGEITSIVTKSK